MIDCILTEIELRQNMLHEDIRSIYFGGGTPSLISPEHIKQIIEQIGKYFRLKTVSEITLEANPEDISSKSLDEWQEAGVNRLSLGIQTFDDNSLKKLNRSHTGQEAVHAVDLIKNSGIKNITIDLMYGLPYQDFKAWEENLSKVINLDIPHISAYALTIEKQTVLGVQEEKGQVIAEPDEQYEAQYLYMCDQLSQAGYEHYEVSNFSKKGFRSQHNQQYWQGNHYLGLGPGAHSFDGNNRIFNISNNARYIRDIQNGILPSEGEVLSDDDKYNEYILTGLRTTTGINIELLKNKFDTDLLTDHQQFLDKCTTDKLAVLEDESFILTEKGFFVSDAIILKLMR